jgi:hypothetical protein
MIEKYNGTTGRRFRSLDQGTTRSISARNRSRRVIFLLAAHSLGRRLFAAWQLASEMVTEVPILSETHSLRN